MSRVPEAHLDELEQLVDDYLHTLGDPDLHYLTGLAANAPAEAASEMLCIDALGEYLLTDEQVGHLWAIGFDDGYAADELVPDEILQKARPERRTRPTPPVRFPLKGGGHGSGRGVPGKSEYPARWSDEDAMALVMDVAQTPDGAVRQPDGMFRAHGVRDGVELRVIVTELGQVVTAYPVAGEGVVTNPIDELRAPYVERLQRLIDRTELDDGTTAGITELMTAGEWDQVLQQLRALPTPDADELRRLGDAAGLTTPG